MPELPLRRLVLYKHGVGYFERRGAFEGTSLSLRFDRDAMDDVLKSLVVIDMGAGQVRGIDYDRPETWSGRRMNLQPQSTVRDLITQLTGRRVRLALADDLMVEGLLMGFDAPEDEGALASTLVSLYRTDVQQVLIHPLGRIRGIQLLDSAADEVQWSLRSGAEVGEDRTATIQLDEGEHDLLVSYLAPAPSWRVSYRLLVELNEDAPPSLLLQGWGLIDNVLNEDLTDVRLSLVAGRPVSFRYSLYEPQMPDRPFMADEVLPPPMPRAEVSLAMAAPMMAAAPAAGGMRKRAMVQEEAFSDEALDRLGSAMPPQAEAAAQGTLFRYDVREPISVQRGRSALVPLFNMRASCRRDLVYRGGAGERNPMATVRFDNTSGFALERGPVTVIEQRSYGGESIIPWVVEGGEVQLTFSLALEVTVREEHTMSRHTRRLRLGRDVLIHEVEEVRNSVYSLHNTASDQRMVVIVHPRAQGYELFDTAPAEELKSFEARWSLPVPSRGESALRVRERRLVERREAIQSLSLDTLRRYLQDRLLDQATINSLREVLGLYERLERIVQQYAELEVRRVRIHEQQTQIRGNLDVLGSDGDEGELRTRYIATLTESEDALARLRDEELALRDEEQQRRQELEAYLRSFGG